MKQQLILSVFCFFLFCLLTPAVQGAVGVQGAELTQELNPKQEKRFAKFKKRLKKKIAKKQARAKKKGKMVGDVMENRKFILGLIFLGGGLALALLAGLFFSGGFLGWVAGLVAVAGVVLMIIGILETV